MIGKHQNSVALMDILWLVILYFVRLPHTHTYIGYVTWILYIYIFIHLFLYVPVCCTILIDSNYMHKRYSCCISKFPKRDVLYQHQPGYNTPGGYRLPVTSLNTAEVLRSEMSEATQTLEMQVRHRNTLQITRGNILNDYDVDGY